MKLSNKQLRRLIAEERAKLVTEQGETLISETPSELEDAMAMAMQEEQWAVKRLVSNSRVSSTNGIPEVSIMKARHSSICPHPGNKY